MEMVDSIILQASAAEGVILEIESHSMNMMTSTKE